jgi:hypothetical protein
MPEGPPESRPQYENALTRSGLLLGAAGVGVAIWATTPLLGYLANRLAGWTYTVLGWEATPLVGKLLLAAILIGAGALLFFSGLAKSSWFRFRNRSRQPALTGTDVARNEDGSHRY